MIVVTGTPGIYYYLTHFSRFIKPVAFRINCTGDPAQLYYFYELKIKIVSGPSFLDNFVSKTIETIFVSVGEK